MRSPWIKVAVGLLIALSIALQLWRLANLGRGLKPGEISLLAFIAVLILPGILLGFLVGVPLGAWVNRRMEAWRWNIVVRRFIRAAIILGCVWGGWPRIFGLPPSFFGDPEIKQ